MLKLAKHFMLSALLAVIVGSWGHVNVRLSVDNTAPITQDNKSNSDCSQKLLNPDQLLLSESNRLWILDTKTLSIDLCLTFTPQSGFAVAPSTVTLAPKGNKLYYLAWKDATGQI